jgi:hypothetical protein
VARVNIWSGYRPHQPGQDTASQSWPGYRPHQSGQDTASQSWPGYRPHHPGKNTVSTILARLQGSPSKPEHGSHRPRHSRTSTSATSCTIVARRQPHHPGQHPCLTILTRIQTSPGNGAILTRIQILPSWTGYILSVQGGIHVLLQCARRETSPILVMIQISPSWTGYRRHLPDKNTAFTIFVRIYLGYWPHQPGQEADLTILASDEDIGLIFLVQALPSSPGRPEGGLEVL